MSLRKFFYREKNFRKYSKEKLKKSLQWKEGLLTKKAFGRPSIKRRPSEGPKEITFWMLFINSMYKEGLQKMLYSEKTFYGEKYYTKETLCFSNIFYRWKSFECFSIRTSNAFFRKRYSKSLLYTFQLYFSDGRP